MNMRSYSCCLVNKQGLEKIDYLSSFLKLVYEKSRLKILCLLNQKKHCVCELIDHLRMSQSLVSHHLKDLKEAGVVNSEKKGLRVYYSLTEKGKKVINLILKI